MDKLNKLLKLNVNEYTQKKGGLTYLSWANAWKEFLKAYPEATYNIRTNENGTPQFGSSEFGYMVFTEVTAGGITREMFLPVLNGANKPMKDEGYSYTTRYGKEKEVDAINMFDINKAVMRCLTKNLAMFGLGLYIYAGEDLPEETKEPLPQDKITALYAKAGEKNFTDEDVKKTIKNSYNVTSTKDLTVDQFKELMDRLDKAKTKKEDKKYKGDKDD
jgi:hypothetical protein